MRASIRIESIPGATDGADRARLVGRAQLAAQIANVHVDDVRAWLVVRCPDRGEDLGARYDLIGMAHQVLEERELARRELDEAVAAPPPATPQGGAPGGGPPLSR